MRSGATIESADTLEDCLDAVIQFKAEVHEGMNLLKASVDDLKLEFIINSIDDGLDQIEVAIGVASAIREAVGRKAAYRPGVGVCTAAARL